MLFWTPDIPSSLHDWLCSTTERVLCCEVNSWNCTASSELERRISTVGKCSCIPLTVNGEHSESIISSIWQHLSSKREAIDDFVDGNCKFRRNELRQQVKSGGRPDLGIYDCADLLSHADMMTVLCCRISGTVPTYLSYWIDYTVQNTRCKVIVLHPKNVSRISQLKHLDRLILPVLSKDCIVEACEYAVYRLTGAHIQRSDLDAALTYSCSMNECISIVQLTTVSQCSIEVLLSAKDNSFNCTAKTS